MAFFGCQGPISPRPPSQATGVVISAEGPNAAQVDSVSVRTDDGQVLELRVGRLDLSNGGLPAPHLREHLVSGEPVIVFYYGDELIRYVDAPVGMRARHGLS